MQEVRAQAETARNNHEGLLAEQVKAIEEDKNRQLDEVMVRVEQTMKRKDELVQHLREQLQVCVLMS